MGGSGSACFGGLRRDEGIAHRQLMVLVFGLLRKDEGITGGELKFEQIYIGRQHGDHWVLEVRGWWDGDWLLSTWVFVFGDEVI